MSSCSILPDSDRTALDQLSDRDTNPNSVFTRTFVQLLDRPGISLQELAKTTQGEVKTLAKSVNHLQMPAYYDQIDGSVVLAPNKNGKQVRTSRRAASKYRGDVWGARKTGVLHGEAARPKALEQALRGGAGGRPCRASPLLARLHQVLQHSHGSSGRSVSNSDRIAH